jgi:fatty acid amide hydrolase
VKELHEIHNERDIYCQNFHDYWISTGVDFVICPVNAYPAIKHGAFQDISFAASYTMLYSLLDYSGSRDDD